MAPITQQSLVHSVKQFARRVFYRGANRYCPVCDSTSRIFSPAGLDPRLDAACYRCGAVERHRLVFQFLKDSTNLWDGQVERFLHVAPEPAFVPIFADAVGSGYLTADLKSPLAMEKMDISDIHHPDNTFDAIYCSHVLEHVPDDRRAIAEFFRVLKPGGWAILNVPIFGQVTVEDPTIADPAERRRRFGQEDHVRCYGADYIERLAEVGFLVQKITPADVFGADQLVHYGVATAAARDIFYCTKP